MTVRIVLEHGGAEQEVDLAIEDPHAPVAALTEAAAPGASEDWVVLDGRPFGPDARLEHVGLYEGARVRVCHASAASGVDVDAPPPDGPVLGVAGGLAAGGRHPIGSEVVVGRERSCDVVLDDPTVSARHARVWSDARGRSFVEDLGSRNGTWLDGAPVSGCAGLADGALLRLGASELRFVAGLPADRPAGIDPAHRARGGFVPFNRPPRAAPPAPPGELTAPEPVEHHQAQRALSLAAIAAPLLLGMALIAMYREPRFALFMLLSPVVAIATWLSSRRQARRQRRGANRVFQRALHAFDAALAGVAVEEAGRREAVLPDLAEVTRRATAPSTRLWERRGDDADALHLRVGTGDVPWEPRVVSSGGLDDAVAARVEGRSVLARSPVGVDLSAGVVGLVGDRTAATALARALMVQLATHHGPADAAMAVFAAPDRAAEWSWSGWLPHLRDELGSSRLAFGPEAADAVVAQLLAQQPSERTAPPPASSVAREAGPTTVAVVDDPALLDGRRSPVRRLLQDGNAAVTGIVLAPSVDQLPAVTSTVIELRGPLGDGVLTRPREQERLPDVVVGGMTETLARDVARTLARYDDPELGALGAGLPLTARLVPLLGLDEIAPQAIEALWADDRSRRGLVAPLGVSEDGPLWLDLVADGPHALVGGTTGSGKSELLRSLVAGLATGSDCDHVVFVLVDYKGGSAFDACAALPHCVGLVTDLDAHLGERALRSLDAEVRHRERVLRDAGADDLAAYVAAGAPAGPLPRLMVVVDEFATLAVELPDFLGALVAVAQRGRSLGVHLVLATQRPAGVVSSAITANTNLRIALRVQSATDSTDVVGRPDAAGIPRDAPGRGYVRFGHGDVVAVQTALATGHAEQTQRAVRLRPLSDGIPVDQPAAGGHAAEVSDLAQLVAAIAEAERRRGADPPRRPWLEMLPETLDFAALGPARHADELLFALADDPGQQRQTTVGWRLRDGHLAVFGGPGAGKTTVLRALVRAIVERHDPDTCHLYAVDAASGGLHGLEGLPHCGAVVTARDSERRLRVLRRLRDEIDCRRGEAHATLDSSPWIVLLVDGVAALLTDIDEPDAVDAGEAFRRILADGPAVGVVMAMTCDRPAALPVRIASAISQRLLLRLADSADYATAGLRPSDVPELVPGRGVRGEDGLVVQIADPGPCPSDWGVGPAAGSGTGPAPVEVLPELLPTDGLPLASAGARGVAPAAEGGVAGTNGRGAESLRVVVGLADVDLGPARLALAPGAHALVAGPPGSGKSFALALLAERLRDADAGLVLVGVCGTRSPLHASPALDAAGSPRPLAAVLDAALYDRRRWVVLVDDVADVEDDAGRLASLLRAGRAGVHVVAAGRTDELRRAYSHWSRPVRQSRTGILLQPDLTADGELLNARLPRRLAVPLVPGRGFVVGPNGPALAQLAIPRAAAAGDGDNQAF